MIIYPAIDLKDGKCVRLLRGQMDKATVFGDNPTHQAKQFADDGAKWLHVVDLNGAFAGKPVNKDAVNSILQEVNIPVQLGGGIRDIETIDMWIDAGISRVILGTAAVKNPALIEEACKKYQGKIAVGIDAKSGMVSLEGWDEVSDIDAISLAARYQDIGVSCIIYTDISRDGAMQGLNIEATQQLAEAVNIPVIASGGVATLDDLHKVRAAGLSGVIIGRALYEGAFTLQEALRC